MEVMIKPMESPLEIEGKAYVHWKSWQETYTGLVDQGYLDRLTLERCTENAYRWRDNILVAKIEDKVIGFMCYGSYRDDTLPDTGEVFAIYVLREYHGQKVGYALMQAALRKLSEFRQVALWVLKGNERAIGFYEKIGFRFDGVEQAILLGSENTELRMVLADFHKNQ